MEPSSTSTTSHGRPQATSATRQPLDQLVDVAGLVEDRHDDAHIGPRSILADRGRRQHGLLFSGRRHREEGTNSQPAPAADSCASPARAHYVETRMAAAVETLSRSHRPRRGGRPGGGGLPGHAPRAACGASRGTSTRRRSRASRAPCTAISATSSSPRATRRASLPSWLGAGLIGVGIEPVTAMRLLSAAGAALAAACGGLIMLQALRPAGGPPHGCLSRSGRTSSSMPRWASTTRWSPDSSPPPSSSRCAWRAAEARPRRCCSARSSAPAGSPSPRPRSPWRCCRSRALLFDYASPRVRRRLLEWTGYAVLALALGYALDLDRPLLAALRPARCRSENHRELGQVFDDIWPGCAPTARGVWEGVHRLPHDAGGRLRADRRRRRGAAATARPPRSSACGR